MKLRRCRCLSAGFSSRVCPLSAAQEAIIVLQVILTYAGRTKNKYIPIYTHLVEKTDPESLQKQKQQLEAKSWELRSVSWELKRWGSIRIRSGQHMLSGNFAHAKVALETINEGGPKPDLFPSEDPWYSPPLYKRLPVEMRAGAPLTYTGKHFIMMDGQHKHTGAPKPVFLNSVSCLYLFVLLFFLIFSCCLN